MADFNISLNFVLQNEGLVITTVAGDAGGQTCAGISRNNFPNWVGWKALDSGDTNIHDLMPDIADFYRLYFWFYNGINSQRIANKCMDSCVNLGQGVGIKIIQSAAGVIPADGIFGPHTLWVINNQDPNSLFNSIIESLKTHYLSIVAKNPADEKFLIGWLARAERG